MKYIVFEVQGMKIVCENGIKIQTFIATHQHVEAVYRKFADLQLYCGVLLRQDERIITGYINQ